MTEEKGTWTGFSISDTDRREGAWDAGSFITWGPEQRALNTSESQASHIPDQRSRPSPTCQALANSPGNLGRQKECGKGTGIFLGKHSEGRGVTWLWGFLPRPLPIYTQGSTVQGPGFVSLLVYSSCRGPCFLQYSRPRGTLNKPYALTKCQTVLILILNNFNVVFSIS